MEQSEEQELYVINILIDKEAALVHKNRQNHSRKRNKIALVFLDHFKKINKLGRLLNRIFK